MFTIFLGVFELLQKHFFILHNISRLSVPDAGTKKAGCEIIGLCLFNGGASAVKYMFWIPKPTGYIMIKAGVSIMKRGKIIAGFEKV